jgi:hypothetical protein
MMRLSTELRELAHRVKLETGAGGYVPLFALGLPEPKVRALLEFIAEALRTGGPLPGDVLVEDADEPAGPRVGKNSRRRRRGPVD